MADTAAVTLEMQKKNLVIGQGEQTGFQAVITSPWVMRWAALPATYAVYREIRQFPVLALGRAMTAAAILAGQWSVGKKKGASPEFVQFVEDNYLPLRFGYLENALYYGNVDFGYQAYEQVLDLRDGMVVVKQLRPLLHDITEIVIDNQGQFFGIRQPGVQLSLWNSLHVGYRVEGSHLYGIPLLENCRKIYNRWLDADGAAARYDVKMAGRTVIIRYPVEGTVQIRKGLEVTNAEAAEMVIKQMQASGFVALPGGKNSFTGQDDSGGWDIKSDSDGGSLQAAFTDRLKHLEGLLVQGLELPTRSVSEGSHGTLAEAATHTDASLTNLENRHRFTTARLNKGSLDNLLELNFGPKARGQVFLEAAPLVDAKKAVLVDMLKTWSADPQAMLDIYNRCNADAMLDAVGVPRKENDRQSSRNDSGVIVNGVPPQAAAAVAQVYKQLGVIPHRDLNEYRQENDLGTFGDQPQPGMKES